MENKNKVSTITRKNWILNIGLFLTGFVAIVSGVYFLIFPDGGYKGGRNPYYGIQILFEREGWEWIHTWISLGMVAVAIIHLLFHWKWVLNTTTRILRSAFEHKKVFSQNGWKNTIVDGVLAVGFLICAASGIYLFFVPEVKGGLSVDPMFLFSRTAWDVIHTWSGVAFISAVILHLVIHWGWVTKVTRKILFNRASPVLQYVSIETH